MVDAAVVDDRERAQALDLPLGGGVERRHVRVGTILASWHFSQVSAVRLAAR